MSCSVNVFTEVLIGATPGGVLVFDFYSITQDATADTGGTPIDVGAGGILDFNNAVAGFYYFTYTVGEGDCEQSVQFWIQVVDRPDAGNGDTIVLCHNDDPVNIFSLINGTPDITGTWSGSGTTNAGYDANDPDDPTDDMFDPSLSGNGLFTFIYTVAITVPGGYTISNCPNCANAQSTVTIQVNTCSPPPEPCNAGISNSIQVCRQAACTFNLYDQLDGTPTDNGLWTQLPGSPQVIIISGGYLGTVNFVNALAGTYQFEYGFTDPECPSTIVTVQVVNQPNAGNNITLHLCDSAPNTNIFQFITGNPTAGGTWGISPALPVGTFNQSTGVINPAPGDEGVYTVTYTVTVATNENPCGTTCSDVSTHTINIYESCEAGAISGETVCQNGSITLDAATLTGGTPGGTWFVFGQSIPCNNVFGDAVFSVNGAPAIDHQGDTLNDGDVLDEFDDLGCIAFIYQCTGGHPSCTDTASFMLTVIQCGTGCNAVWTINAAACLMTSSHTGTCTNPIYQWQRFVSGNWVNVPGANASSYTGLHNNTYRLQITNCENCGTLYSNQLTISCPPASCVITCDSFVYNVALQRLEAQWTHNGGGGGTDVAYFFNKATIVTPLCSNCGGWGVNQGNGTGNNTTTAIFNVAQTAVEQCWRIVIQDLPLPNPLCQVVCCVKIPAISAPANYYIPSLPQNSEITGVTVNGSTIWNKALFPAQFNCNDYESTGVNAIMNGNNNCALAQLVNDINQRLTALGDPGNCYVIQSAKSSSLRISGTNIVFNNVLLLGGGSHAFTTTPTTGCDSVTWHFQECESQSNFSVVLDASNGGTFNIFTQMLQLFMPEILNTGTFQLPTGSAITPGCIQINTDCLDPVGAVITITNGGANHGLLTWTSFTPLTNPNNCYFNLRYVVNMPDTACAECILIGIKFKP